MEKNQVQSIELKAYVLVSFKSEQIFNHSTNRLGH